MFIVLISYLCVMQLLREIGFLLRKEIILEWRQRYAISGILLYVISTVFIIYVAFANAEILGPTWNVLYWIVVLFATVNAVAKSFVQESGARQLYYYTLANPLAILFSKIIYNTLLLFLLGLLTFLVFSFITENPVEEIGVFLMALGIGSFGFSIIFTFISAIASKAKNGATLMAILGFPAIIPTLFNLIKLSATSLGFGEMNQVNNDLFILLGIDLILIAAAIVLFPYLWRD